MVYVKGCEGKAQGGDANIADLVQTVPLPGSALLYKHF